METIFTNVFASIGALVLAGGGGALIGVAIFRTIGEQWLSSEFSKRLERFKHDQQKELERVRFGLNSFFDRAVRLHQSEFEVLPETWGRLQDAHGRASVFLSPLQTYPDLNTMTLEHRDEFLERTPLANWQKTELRNASDKTAYYITAIFWHDLSASKNAFIEFNSYLRKRGVFIRPNLAKQFERIADLIWKALMEREVRGPNGHDYYDKAANTALRDEAPDLIAAIKLEVQRSLWDSKELSAPKSDDANGAGLPR